MKKLLEKLDKEEIKFVCSFSNHYITQIPYIDEASVNFLNKDYFIKKLKTKLRKNVLSDIGKTIATNILLKDSN